MRNTSADHIKILRGGRPTTSHPKAIQLCMNFIVHAMVDGGRMCNYHM